MTVRTFRYSVGNEHDPGDPWGRSELVVQPDGAARLDHHYSRVVGVGAWSGRVDPVALDELWSALDRAGFPATPTTPLTPGEALRRLTVEADGQAQRAIVGWHQSAKLPGYAEAFDILDGVVNQLTGGAVPYPTSQPSIVYEVARVSAPD